MADSWTVPLATGLFTDLNQQIAAGPPKLDFSDLKNAPDAYWKGQDQRYTQNQRDVFKDGLPKDANGNVDWNQVSQQLAKVGGAGAIDNVIKIGNYGIARDAIGGINGNGAGSVFSNPQGGPPSSATSVPNRPQSSLGQPQTTADVGGTPAPPGQNITGPGTTVTGVDYGPNTATNSAGGLTPRTLAARTGIDAETLAGGLGVSLDQTLDPNDPMVRHKLASLVRPNTANDAGGAGSSAPIQPTPVRTQSFTPQNQQQQQPPAQPQQVAQNAALQPAQMPQGQMTEQAAAQYESAGRRAAQASAAVAFANPASSAALKDLSDNYFKQASIIRNTIGKNSEFTPEQKNLASGAAGATEAQKLTVQRGDKAYGGIQAQASQFERDLKPYLDLSRSLINDPQMYSGIGGKFALDINRVRAAFGDQKAAMLQEALQKVTASSVLGQINTQRDQLQEAGTTSSRIFSQQVDLVTKAAPSMATTLGGNRFLVEVSDRMGQLSSKVAEMARDYRATHSLGLDAGFDQQVASYMKTHPIFTDQERSHPEVLGAPTVPPDITGNKAQIVQWAHALGVKKGEAIRFYGKNGAEIRALDQ